MTKFVYPVTVSTLFALIGSHSVGSRLPELGPLVFVVTFVLWLISYLLPPRLFAYSNELTAPTVLSQLMKRAALSIALVVAAALFALGATGLWASLPVVQEQYSFTLIGIILFHGFGGPFAYHVVYLQQTKQYNSNQLAAVLIAVSLMLFVLILFFLNLDFGTPRDAAVQIRDLLLLSTVLVGYGWTVYKVAHH